MGQVQLVVDTIEQLAARFARRVEQLSQNRRQRAPLRIAISGGSVLSAFLPRLLETTLEPASLEVFFCDERAVPLNHPDSNFRQARIAWLERAHVPGHQVHPFFGASSLEQSARDYEQLLRRRPECPLDVVLLGMGADGHVASLFPGHVALESRDWAVVVHDAPKPPAERLTLTIPVLSGAPEIFLGASGEDKGPILARALGGDQDLPVSRVFRAAHRVQVFVDAALARGLPPGSDHRMV